MLVISKHHIKQCIDMPKAIELMGNAFAELSTGKGEVPIRHILENENTKTTGMFMPASLPAIGALGLKVIGMNDQNISKGLPLINATIMLLNIENGKPEALMEAGWITALRTGAGSGLATQFLAKPNAKKVALFGVGVQARTQLEAVCSVRQIEEIKVFNRTKDKVIPFCNEMTEKLSVLVTPGNISDLKTADIICTATNSTIPLFNFVDINPGVHINAIGAYTPAMVEIPPKAVAASKLIVDRKDACFEEAGDVIQAIDKGFLKETEISGEIGEIVTGRISARKSDEEITLFKSVGNAAQDLVVAHHVYTEAKKRKLGQFVEL